MRLQGRLGPPGAGQHGWDQVRRLEETPGGEGGREAALGLFLVINPGLIQSGWERPTSQRGLETGTCRLGSRDTALLPSCCPKTPGEVCCLQCGLPPGLCPGPSSRMSSLTQVWVRSPFPDCCCLDRPISQCSVCTSLSLPGGLRVPDISRPQHSAWHVVQ